MESMVSGLFLDFQQVGYFCIDYELVRGYYIPGLKLSEENRPTGKYGILHRAYLKEYYLAWYSSLILTGELWTYLADLNE